MNVKVFDPVPPKIEAIGKQIARCAQRVHKELGPGLLQSIYEACLAHELAQHGLEVQRQVPVPVVYDGVTVAEGLYIDLLVEGHVAVEVLSVRTIEPIHGAYMTSCLRFSGKRLGLMVNFGAPNMKQGIKRVVG